MTQEIFKLPRSSYDELTKIIRAYGTQKGKASIKDIARIAVVGESVVSANNSFLSSISIIEQEGKSKIITEKGYSLANALDHNMFPEISDSWKEIILENDFLSKIVQAIKIREGMEISQLENHIAYSAGEANKKFVLTGARAVIDILAASKLITIDNDKVILNESISATDKSDEEKELNLSKDDLSEKENKKTDHQININFQININISSDDIETLGPKLIKLISEINENYSNN